MLQVIQQLLTATMELRLLRLTGSQSMERIVTMDKELGRSNKTEVVFTIISSKRRSPGGGRRRDHCVEESCETCPRRTSRLYWSFTEARNW